MHESNGQHIGKAPPLHLFHRHPKLKTMLCCVLAYALTTEQSTDPSRKIIKQRSTITAHCGEERERERELLDFHTENSGARRDELR